MVPPAVVLHRPQLGENIGAAARVMGNFGLSDLRLVAPRDGWPSARADTMAAGALEGVVTARVFDTLSEALSDIARAYATTARPRDMERPVMGPREALAEIRAAEANEARTAVVFGGESSGLPNEAVAACDVVLTYPVEAAFSSLNLAQAVAVFAYEWRAGADDAPPASFARPPADMATKLEIAGLADHLEEALDDAGFYWPEAKAETMKANLRATIARQAWTSQEVRTLRGALKALVDRPADRRRT